VLPYLKGSSLYIILLFIMNVLVYLAFKGLFMNLRNIFSLISLNFYYKWHSRSFLGMKWEIRFSSFCIFLTKKKRGHKRSSRFMKLCVNNLKKPMVYLNSSWKNTQLKKKNIQNEVWEVEIRLIKINIFLGFLLVTTKFFADWIYFDRLHRF